MLISVQLEGLLGFRAGSVWCVDSSKVSSFWMVYCHLLGLCWHCAVVCQFIRVLKCQRSVFDCWLIVASMIVFDPKMHCFSDCYHGSFTWAIDCSCVWVLLHVFSQRKCTIVLFITNLHAPRSIQYRFVLWTYWAYCISTCTKFASFESYHIVKTK